MKTSDLLLTPERTTLHRVRLTRRAALGAVAGTLLTWRGANAEKQQPAFVLSWGKRGEAEGEFDPPIGITIGRDDRIHVTDWRNHRVQTFDTAGKVVRVIPVAPYPGGIAVDPSGRLYVAHFKVEADQQHQVTVYDAAGKPAGVWGRSGSGPGEFSWPGGIAVGPDGSVYVADETNHRIQRFTPEGRLLGMWGEYGTGPGQFGGNEPRGSRTGGPQMLAVDRAGGDVYSTEGSVCRVQKFTADGRYLWSWVNASSGPGGFGGRPRNLQGPIGICLDRDERLWITSTNNRVQQFTTAGRYLRGFGKTGTGPGEFMTPHGLAFDSRGHLYVVDAQNCRIQKFAVGP
jgi:DNA-binding beta-propeller fold protein YncE